jgi:hypothetical protein
MRIGPYVIAGASLLSVSSVLVVPQPKAAAATTGTSSACSTDVTANLTHLGLTAANQTTPDTGFSYTIWSGHVASWDGVPLQLSLTVPVGPACGLPLVSQNHGYGSNASTMLGTTDAGHWDNVWWAEQGYATLGFTQRGFDQSCGPTGSSNGTPSGLPTACTADGRHYWMTLDDVRYSPRDLQWLIGRLVDAGVVSPSQIAVTGRSMGGGLSWEMAVLNDRTVCGGYWDPANGPDPCGGRNGGYINWTSPSGIPLHVAAAVPEWGWASLGGVLVPNGTASDGLNGAPPSSPYGEDAHPIGVPLPSWVNVLDNPSDTFFAPPGSDPSNDWSSWFSDLKSQVNTQTTTAASSLGSAMSWLLFQADAEKSPASYYLGFDSDVPILALQGLDDGLMTPVQAQLMYQEAKAHDPAYPISVVWGDVGHAPATNPSDVYNDFDQRATAFLAAAFGRGGSTASGNESAYLMRCGVNTGGGLTEATAGTLAALETGTWTVSSTQARTTTNLAAGSESSALGNVNQSSCPRTAVQQDANVASWTWPVTSASTLFGAPVITLKVRTTGVDAQLDARLWIEDGRTQTLISTGPYRLAGVSLGLTDTTVTYEVPMTAWSLRPGEVLKLEITGDDAPTYQADLLPAITTIDSASLKLPTTDLATYGAAYKLSAKHGVQFSGTAGNFVGATSTLAGSYQATVDWGDGTVSSGTVSYAGGGWCVVKGAHTWARPGRYQTKVTLVSASGVTVVHFGQVTVS